jgi:hypothetical protein
MSKLFWWEAGNWLIVVINFRNMRSDVRTEYGNRTRTVET